MYHRFARGTLQFNAVIVLGFATQGYPRLHDCVLHFKGCSAEWSGRFMVWLAHYIVSWCFSAWVVRRIEVDNSCDLGSFHWRSTWNMHVRIGPTALWERYQNNNLMI